MVAVGVAGATAAVVLLDHGQRLHDEDAEAGAASGLRLCIAIDAGSALAEVAKPTAHAAAPNVMSQALGMAVLLDIVDRQLPCWRYAS